MFRRRRSEDDFAEEIRSHLELEADELRREGFSEEEAHRRAKVEFGNAQTARERFYLRGRVIWFDNLVRDIQFAIRQLTRNPGFAVVAFLVLALGVGASVAIFAFVDAALLEPLPYASPDRLMSVSESDTSLPGWPLSYPDFLDWKAENKSFSSLDIYTGSGYLLRTRSGAEPVHGERVSGGFFQTLGVRPLLGRDFNPGENQPGGPNVTLLSYGAWVRRFGARPEIVGQTIDLDNEAYTIIGVLPQSFSFAPSGNAEFWVPINKLSLHEHSRTFYNFAGIGRLRDGVTVASAQSEVRAISNQIQQQYAITGHDLNAGVTPLSEVMVGDVRPILLTLLCGAGLLLLIACVNVSSLVLVRAENRRREIAVRGALGATPARLVKQFVTEAVVLAACGSSAGIILAATLIPVLARLVPVRMASGMPFLDRVGLNVHTAGVATATALLTTLLLAITPILRLPFRQVHADLADGGRGAASEFWSRLGANLVVFELAIAVVLLAGAGLLGRSLYHLLHVHLGFDSGHLATVEIALPSTLHQNSEQIKVFNNEVLQRATSLPGVESAGLTSRLPVQCNCSTDGIRIVGRPYHGEHNEVNERHVSPGYLPALKAGLIRGRFFTEEDDASRPGVAVINQTLARRYFPDQDPIGQSIANDEGGRPSTWQIVGVIDDVREGPLDAEIAPTEYFPVNQTGDRSFTLAVRSSRDAGALLPEMVSSLHEVNPNLGVSNEATMVDKIDTTQAALLHRFAALLVGGFAVMALVLGVVGLYGVVSYSVGQRKREIGVRMALGAQRSSVYRLIIRQAAWLVLVGLTVGLLCSLGTSILMRRLLFGVHAWDAVTLVGVSVLLGLSSLAASFLPARRAASVDPVEALRAE
ncbi:ABC transporter permease [Terriglobus albidus]|uniref:ABC transporter permease n=1 Tax=Terriglobus albidus TaxID=1592106 RepID=UPI0021E0C55E|nr:ABC transporter permease [Terriglobus albidus]